ncbi:hypothetical protein NP233_g2262 [Leucocoprinus birnbaumii]|uniref:Uncharacterized protein n=1 Tax=Leucocoprinus birnbaumii TaxID=56174 RepID=A0AAD5YYY2_9AGAR|nr:hypothetical protein NP233_g2262 [Leucocoprinus birnbaumii]
MSHSELVQLCQDDWTLHPMIFTSHLSLRRHQPGDNRSQMITCKSPVCELGWAFEVEMTAVPPDSWFPNPSDRVSLYIQPGMRVTGMGLTAARITVDTPILSAPSHTKEFKNVVLDCRQRLGVYLYPTLTGDVRFDITLTFDEENSRHLVFPAPAIANFSQSLSSTNKALRNSLDDPSFIDTKFYLFSAKCRGKPTGPRSIYAKSTLLIGCSEYIQDLLSPQTEFQAGTQCNIRDQVSEEIAKLDPDSYDYESDSDLDDVDEKAVDTATTSRITANDASEMGRGRAYAINGTAYKTWKAFIIYAYTNDIEFNALKSRLNATSESDSHSVGPERIACSPKSMYRLADYVGTPALKVVAKEAIAKNLSKSNIISELFSSFTHKYQEIIELEVDFLLKNMTDQVGRDLNQMLEVITSGSKPQTSRVLAFTIRRMLCDSHGKAWNMLDGGGSSQSSTQQGTLDQRPDTPSREGEAEPTELPAGLSATPTWDSVNYVRGSGRSRPLTMGRGGYRGWLSMRGRERGR